MTSTSGDNDLDVFQQFYSKLVDTLPMDDVRFIAQLYSERLLPGNLKSLVKAQKTSADKAALFLDSVIEPSVTSDGGNSFDKLLDVMTDSEYQHVKELAKQIRSNLAKRSDNDNGMLSFASLALPTLLSSCNYFGGTCCKEGLVTTVN